ncbi:MAG TPA: hypothetical protein PLU49_14575 [Saprospiraceae bacterium]|nr:hypothetical protein [Saprospiraceae bacterium]
MACDLSDMLIATNLSNGKIRVELIGSTMFDIYEWTFSDGSKAYGNPINIDCNQKSNGSVTLDVWNLNPGVPAGKQRICHGSILYYCNCGVKKEKKDKHIWTNAGGSGKEITIEAAIWVKDGEIGCKSKHFAKNFLGIWVPLNLIFNTTGVCANLAGSFTKEVSQGNCIIVNVPFNEKCMSVGSPNGSWQNIITQTGKNFIDPGKLSSGHRLRLKTGGTFFGFGVDKPRLVLN